MTDWIEWRGGECPVDFKTLVTVKFRDGYCVEDEVLDAACWGWEHRNSPYDIVAYRIVKEATD